MINKGNKMNTEQIAHGKRIAAAEATLIVYTTAWNALNNAEQAYDASQDAYEAADGKNIDASEKLVELADKAYYTACCASEAARKAAKAAGHIAYLKYQNRKTGGEVK